MKDAMKHGRRPNEARTKKNIETDLIGDKIGRVHLGKQDLSTLQTRKMKGLKRSRDDVGDEVDMPNGVEGEEDIVSQDEEVAGGMEVDPQSDLEASSDMGSEDEISIGDEDDDEEMGDAIDDQNKKPKRQRIT